MMILDSLKLFHQLHRLCSNGVALAMNWERWKEEAVTYFRALSQHLLGGTVESHKKGNLGFFGGIQGKLQTQDLQNTKQKLE
jgi:hypothetical protein